MSAQGSFDDIRSIVETALASDYPSKGDGDTDSDCPRVYACDIGSDWVVYRDPSTKSRGYLKRGYEIDGDTAKLGDKPTPVARITTYQPVNSSDKTDKTEPATDLKGAADQARAAFADKRQAENASAKSAK